MNLTQLLKWFAFCGVVAGIGLTAVDFGTSVMGVAGLFQGRSSLILAVVPVLIAFLALAFNACSAYIIVMFREKQFADATKVFLMLCWVGLLAFDIGSSVLGLLGEIAGRPLTCTADIAAAVNMCDGAQVFAAIAIGILAALGPFLTTVFYDLVTEGKGGGIMGLFTSLVGG